MALAKIAPWPKSEYTTQLEQSGKPFTGEPETRHPAGTQPSWNLIPADRGKPAPRPWFALPRKSVWKF